VTASDGGGVLSAVRNIHRSSRQERGFGRDATLDDVARAAMSSAAEENDVGREYIVVDDRRQRRRRRRRRAFNQHERHTAESDGPSCSLDPAIHQTLPLLRLSVRNNVVRRRRGKSVATWSVSRSVGLQTIFRRLTHAGSVRCTKACFKSIIVRGRSQFDTTARQRLWQ